jgi:AraC family transcriptional regulator of adaptative response/methylated-DNA-[protein]-cysteine methyltransferase
MTASAQADAPFSDQRAPRAPRLGAVERACRLIERAEETPPLAALAAAAGLSAWHFHRVFKATTGVTPKEYGAAQRGKRARAALERGRSVTDAIYDAGFASSGRFYETSDRMLGMTPTQYRAGGAATEIRHAVAPCSLGFALVGQSARGVCAILLGDEPEALRAELRRRFPRARLVAGDRAFGAVVARVVACVETPRLGLDLPLDVRGTAFQHRVWRALRDIPAGTTATYSEIARRIGAPRAVRAVAGACAANPLAVAIPCHRVVRNDGGLAGYRWGLPRKQALLDRELDREYYK